MIAKLTGPARRDALADLKHWKEVPGRDAIRRDLKFADFNQAWGDRKSTRLNSSHVSESRMPSSA